MAGDLGFDISIDTRHRTDSFLFGESQSRVVITITPDQHQHVVGYLEDSVLPFRHLGTVTKSGFVMDETAIMTVEEAKNLYDNALGDIME